MTANGIVFPDSLKIINEVIFIEAAMVEKSRCLSNLSEKF